MFLASEEKFLNTTKREIIIECSCGTHSIHIISFDDELELYFELWSSNFCTKQKLSFPMKVWHKLKMIWFAISGKEYQLEDILLNPSDIDNIVKALKTIMSNKQEVREE